ncbi:cell wall anchor protein [Bacillus cereus]|nr:cell wall anchor protein [Bacillus cereus]
MMKKSKWLATLMLIFFFVMNIGRVDASMLKYSVEPVIPENQKDKKNTYFDLNMKPNDEQTIKIHMRNDTNEDVTVIPTIKTATTNINGIVEYGESNQKPDNTVPFKIEDIVSAKTKEVTIPKNGATDLELEIKMPKEEFDGILAGGITLQEKEKEGETKETKKEGLSIENRYAYTVAIVLHENDKPVEPKLALDKVEPSQVNARNVINATIQNPNPRYMNQLAVETKITRKGETEVLYSSEKKDMQMAPNTSFAYPTSLDGKELKAGKYTLDMTAKSSGETWHFKKDFEIKGEVAKKFNEKDVSIKKDYTWVYIVVGFILILIAVLFIILFFRKKMKEKDKEAKLLQEKMERIQNGEKE